MPSLFDIPIEHKEKKDKEILTFVPPVKEDGAIEIETSGYSSYSGMIEHAIDLDKIPATEYDLIQTYRQIAYSPEIDIAIQEITNEAIITEENQASVNINLDGVDSVSEGIKKKISDEFDEMMRLLNFKNTGYGLFRKWYIDGQLYFHKLIDSEKPQQGIQAIIPIDPLNIKKIREFKNKRSTAAVGMDVYNYNDVDEYYIYSKIPIKSSPVTFTASSMVKIPTDAITHITSGLVSADGTVVLSYLYKAIKPYNNLKLMEDSLVIYRVSRAPERRVFYIDTGDLPKGRADQYVREVVNRFNTKLTYDVNTGTISNRRNIQSMLEDYYIPRHGGGRGTEITTLAGGQQLGEIDDVNVFKTKLYSSLNVPVSRFQEDSGAMFNIGRATEITRDEIRFAKFIRRLRNTFSQLFDDILKTQLLLKKIITEEEWNQIEQDLIYDFLEDNYFSELKEMEILQERLNVIQALQSVEAIGKYISHTTVRKDILKQTDEEIEREDELIEKEKDKFKDEDSDSGY